jgi:hypothetical protein
MPGLFVTNSCQVRGGMGSASSGGGIIDLQILVASSLDEFVCLHACALLLLKISEPRILVQYPPLFPR